MIGLFYTEQLDFARYGIISPAEMMAQSLTAEQNPPFDQYEHGQRFTDWSLKWRNGEVADTSPEKIERIRREFYQAHQQTPTDALDAIWAPTVERFMRNPAFAQYYQDYCLKSEYYPYWPLNVPTARAVVGSFGYGWNLEHEFGLMPALDDHRWWSEHQEILRYILDRGKKARYFIAEQHERLRMNGTLSRRKQQICVLAAGYMPEFTMLDKVKSTKR